MIIKAEVIARLEQAMLNEESRYMLLMDVLGTALDYVHSSEDKRAEMAEFFKNKKEE